MSGRRSFVMQNPSEGFTTCPDCGKRTQGGGIQGRVAMSGYVWRDPARRKAGEKEKPPRPPVDVPETACVFCRMTGVPFKTLRGGDPVCEDDDACLTRGWAPT